MTSVLKVQGFNVGSSSSEMGRFSMGGASAWSASVVKGLNEEERRTIELGGRYPDEVLLDGLLEVLDVRITFGEVYRLEGVVGRA